jgi:hypothetical protein
VQTLEIEIGRDAGDAGKEVVEGTFARPLEGTGFILLIIQNIFLLYARGFD